MLINHFVRALWPKDAANHRDTDFLDFLLVCGLRIIQGSGFRANFSLGPALCTIVCLTVTS